MNTRIKVAILISAGALLLGGCLDRELKPLNPCLVSGVVAEIAVTNIDKVDLMFGVDNSGSMREEQVALRDQFPKLIAVLTTGMRAGKEDFPPAKDIHLGVVSTDMGLVGIQGIPGCEGLGDDGVMQNTADPALMGCQASYPRFLTYTANVNDPMQTATDFGCIASLGTEGCGFEQQLESALKGLWPSVDRDADGNVLEPNRILFLGDVNGAGQLGHGDTENAGFIRNDPVTGISLIALVLVTDEEDCSAADTRHFTPDIFLEPGDPLIEQDLNLRCFFNPGNLYALDRYVNGFKELRPGAEQLVIFAAIAGVPPDLVDEAAREGLDLDDPLMADAYYQKILDDPRMQEVPDPNRTPEQGGNLTPSCITDTGRAFPPRRIVEVAKQFGANGVIQSICQDDFSGAMDAIIEVIAKQLGAVCLPRKLVRDSDGLVGCNVVWELPPPGLAPSNTPTACSDTTFLVLPDEGRETVSDKGGNVCKVSQLPVSGGVFDATMGQGWYYDDFSEDVMKECPMDAPQRVAFTPDAKPPTGVVVKLECLNETQSLVNNRTDILVGSGVFTPSVGDGCDNVTFNGAMLGRNEACHVRLADSSGGPDNDGVDRSMFCHSQLNICVLACTSDADCPAAWVCDDRPETVAATVESGDGKAICVNPTCGGSG